LLQNGAPFVGVPHLVQNLGAGGFTPAGAEGNSTGEGWLAAAWGCELAANRVSAPHLLQNIPLTGDPHLLQKLAIRSLRHSFLEGKCGKLVQPHSRGFTLLYTYRVDMWLFPILPLTFISDFS
jgi:hypothetical protein